MKFRWIIVILLVFLIGCSSSTQTMVTEEVVFHGEGKDWIVKYIYNPELYEEKKVNWVELEHKDLAIDDIDLNEIDIEFKGNDGTLTGNLGEMKTEIHDDVISFLVGTVNFETYEEDEYKLILRLDGKKDVIKLKYIN